MCTYTYTENKHKCVKREQGKRRLQIKQTNMEEKEGKRMVGVHHLGAEKSGATRPSQARPEARLWLRDHLGRQAWSAEEVKGAGGRTDRRENRRRAKNREEDPRGTSRDEATRTARRPSWRHPVWQDRPTDKGGGAWPLRCHVLGLRAAPTFGLKDKSDERVSRRGVLRRLPVCYCYASYRYS